MLSLEGKRVVLTGSRKTADLSVIVEKFRGIPVLRPTQTTVAVNDHEVEREVVAFIERATDWVILTTGVGGEILCQAAERLGIQEDFILKLRTSRIAARGYKTVRFLKTLEIEPTVRDDDGTTAGLLRALEHFDLKGKKISLQLYGDHAPRLVQWLKAQNAEIYEILPYKHIAPELSIVETLISEILQGEVDAVTFTSTPQVRFLMEYARKKAVSQQIVAAFQGDIVAVAVGKVTAEALKEEGIDRVITPKEERMGSMIAALARYYEENRKSDK
ncbi:uroporphyrinogen-III synthase [Fodinisporobacter ferrooxydans]|uniref:Uroporphyrinogen-III synthase n=1 Tax=Fodinisporobacter ferrooxydans TaxID=2901836 RepID=A0ABY4CTK3_9BACL|nr:uroporphyrinogen-III synthase [Alicyclobacillaceae bacterium MYW30-H2]